MLVSCGYLMRSVHMYTLLLSYGIMPCICHLCHYFSNIHQYTWNENIDVSVNKIFIKMSFARIGISIYK